MGTRKQKKQTFIVPRTPEQEEYFQKLQTARELLKAATQTRDSLLKNCKHSIAYSVDHSYPEFGPDGNCWCNICNEHFGHYCPESPDHGCHYYTEDDGLHVKLFTGEIVRKPIDPHDPTNWAGQMITVDDNCKQWETDDVCLFCGAPDERK